MPWLHTRLLLRCCWLLDALHKFWWCCSVFARMHQMETERTHLWFCSLFSWHFSRTLARYSNMKLPPKCQEAAQPSFEKWLLLSGNFPVPGQGKGLPRLAPESGTSPSQTHLHTFGTVVCHFTVLAGCTFSLSVAQCSDCQFQERIPQGKWINKSR